MLKTQVPARSHELSSNESVLVDRPGTVGTKAYMYGYAKFSDFKMI